MGNFTQHLPAGSDQVVPPSEPTSRCSSSAQAMMPVRSLAHIHPALSPYQVQQQRAHHDSGAPLARLAMDHHNVVVAAAAPAAAVATAAAPGVDAPW